MLGRMVCLLFAGALLLVWMAPVAYADRSVTIDQQYQMSGRDIIVHIVSLNIVDRPLSNIMPQPGMMYYQLVYSYENFGDGTDKGFVQPIFIDANGNQSRYMEYTSRTVPPHVTLPDFIEMGFPEGTVITKIVFIEGADKHEISIPPLLPTPTPAAPSGTPLPSASPPAGGFAWRECLPLIPFALVFGLGGVGVVINRSGIIKR